MPFPTPTLPITPNTVVRFMEIPNDILILGAINDCLVNLLPPENWEHDGEEFSQIMAKMLFSFWESTDVMFIGRIEFFPEIVPSTHLALDGSTYDQIDYPLLWDRIPASWKSGGSFTLPDAENRYIKLNDTGYSEGGREDFTLSASEIPLLNVNYIGADPIALEITVGIPVPAAVPVPLSTTVGSASPNSIELNPSFITLIPAIFAKYPD